MQVGKTKHQGLYNKPSAAVHPGALAAGTLIQYTATRNAVLCDDKLHVFARQDHNQAVHTETDFKRR